MAAESIFLLLEVNSQSPGQQLNSSQDEMHFKGSAQLQPW